MNQIKNKIYLLNKNLTNDKMAWILLEISTIITFTLLVFGNSEITLTIEYSSFPNDATVQFFYDIGNGYHEEYTSKAYVTTQSNIVFPKEYISELKGIRADFSDKEGIVRIKNIKLQKNNINVYTLYPKDMAEQIAYTMNLDYEIINNELVLNNHTMDGQIYFNDILVQQIKSTPSIGLVDIISTVIFLLILGIIVYNRKTLITIWEKNLIHKKHILLISLFIIMIIVSYRKYLTGEKLFVFNGIGRDSIEQTYPNLYRCADLIEKGKELFGFDFTRGYGAPRNINQINIFSWPILFGTENLAYLMGISQVIKIILAFILFYIYLKLLERNEITCFLGAASYSLCGHMIMRQFWKGYSDEVVLSAFLLIALEIAVSRKNYIWLPISLVLYCTTLGEYNSVFALGLVIAYTIFRHLELQSDIKSMVKNILCNVTAYILAVLGSCMYILQPLLKAFSSDRLNKGATQFDLKSLFTFENWTNLRTAFIRTISMGIENKKEIFYSINNMNILEGPTFYCGLVMLMFIPIAICQLNKKRKLTAYSVIIISIAYIVFPNLRYIANGFGHRTTYKLSSFWIIILMLYYGTLGLDFWLNKREDTKHQLVYLWHIGIGLLGIFLARQEQTNLKMFALFIVLIIVIDYISLFKNRMSVKILKYILTVMVMVDLFTNSHIYIDSEIAVSNAQVNNKYTDSSIDYLKGIEKDAFYRIEDKDNKTPACVALVKDYYGTIDYSGGTNMNDSIHRFLQTMNIPKIFPESNHYMTGLSNANELYNFLSVKYITTSESSIDNNYGLELLTEKDGKKIYYNCNMLPIGFCYDSCIDEDEMEKLTIQERRKAILDSCVIKSDTNLHNIKQKDSNVYQTDLEGAELSYLYDEISGEITFDEVAENKVVLLEFDMNCEKSNSFGSLSYGNANGKLGEVNIGSEQYKSVQSFTFTGNKLSYFLNKVGSMSNIKLIAYDRDTYYKKTNEYLQNRKDNQFECTSFSPNYIAGNVNSKENAILYFAIPYDSGWNIFVDGEKANLEKVNYGFCGVYLTSGNHDIVLNYQIPYATITVVISIVGFVLIVMWCVYWKERLTVRPEN